MPASAAYSLDPVGNRLSDTSSLSGVSSSSATFDADDRLSSETYDSNGNTLATGGKAFAYDSENHLTSMNAGAVTLVYDGDGNRVAKTVDGVTTRYLVDDLNPTGYAQVVEELVSSTVEREYTYGLQRISEDQIVDSAWTPSFYGYDGAGSVRQLTNAAGVITDNYEYDAFGNTVNHTGTTPNNYLYRAEQYDSDLGLYYLRARYYNPATGRLLAQDPYAGDIFLPSSLHRYRYVAGDPVNKIDPSGMEAVAEMEVEEGSEETAAEEGERNLAKETNCVLYTGASLMAAVSPEAQLVVVGLQVEESECGAESEREGEEEFENCPLCFAAGTPIHTDHGNVPVEAIAVGEEVLARNHATGKLEYERVSALTPKHHDHLLEIRIEGEHNPLRPSTKHPFWIKRGDAEEGSWMPSGQMRVGDRLLTVDGNWRRITAITPVEKEETVYNFTVDKDHDYFVGQTGFLVHNQDCYCRPYIRKWVQDEVRKRLKFTDDGLPIDPNSGLPFSGPPHLGHVPGFEFWKLAQYGEELGLSREEFIEMNQNPEFYQYENPITNQSHCYEEP